MGALVLGGLCLGLVAPAASAKDAPLIAIELYDGPSGAAYLQLTDVLINGKAEMRDCTAFQTAPVDKSAYNKMAKVTLTPGGILDRGADGVMHYTTDVSQVVCVVPANAKFEHGGAVSLSDLADQGLLHATPIADGGTAPAAAPPIVKGVKLVFVAAPNLELAEFLRAQRANGIDDWQNFLQKFPASPHTAEAKHSLAPLFASAGEASLQLYTKSASTASPDYTALRAAKVNADKALVLAPDLDSSTGLEKKIRDILTTIAGQGRSELEAYRAALASHAAGYSHLRKASKLSDAIAGVDPAFAQGKTLAADVLKENGDFEAALQSAASAATAKQFDQAYAAILPYRAFAEEEERVGAIVDAAYAFHLERGNKLEQSEDWKGAIDEFQKAASVKDTAEARESLKNAQSQSVISQDKDAAAKALASSKEFQQQRNNLRAYEVLAGLPASQQALVADDMKALQPLYVQSAGLEAKNLHQAHSPIRGLADEVGIQKAYAYLQSAWQISGDDSYKDKMDLDGDELSAYLLVQAKHYLDKPRGSGTEMGWTYLEEARQYKGSNLDAVRDAMTAASPAHAMRSKLSIRVQFRDQTSQRDSRGLAGQLENAIITGLESSGVPVKVLRVGEAAAVEPDFELAGDVLDHHLSVVPTIESQESEYRAGEEQIPSEAWNKANRAYENAQQELKTAQAALEAEGPHAKPARIKELTAAVDAAQKKLSDAHLQLDSTPKTVTRDIIRPYSYQKRTIKIGGTIQLQFRIDNPLGEQRGELIPISREDHGQDVLLEEVKPEDTKGVKNAGTTTDTAEFMTQLENSARDELTAAARKRVEALPKEMYQSAAGREKEDDLDGAGESYLRFLNLTTEDNSPERQHAAKFLLENFNMRP